MQKIIKSGDFKIQTKITSFTPNKKRKFCEISETTEENAILSNINITNELGIKNTWFEALKNQFTKPYFLQLREYINEERNVRVIYPLKENVFEWAKIFDVDQTRVVILGQDPYHNPKQAHGLCFSVPPHISPPPSLINIYKELAKDIEGFVIPKHGYLKGWATQGVLLLNSVLTVRENEANSHRDKGWELFTDAVINYINTHLENVVFLLWGAYAQKKCEKINKHLILKAPHPSPLSASKGFFGCKHFSQTNAYLKQNDLQIIDWSYLPTNI